MTTMLTKQVQFTSEQILRIWLGVQTICLFPFMVADLALIHHSFSQCLYANFGYLDRNPFAVFTLGQWVLTDGYIKLAVFVAVVFFNVVALEIQGKSTLVVILGTLLRFYYLFDFGWTVAASVLFWQRNSKLPNPTYIYCDNSPYKSYIYFLLIFTYIIIPINLFICGFRAKKNGELQTTLMSERRATELVEKEKGKGRQRDAEGDSGREQEETMRV